MTRFLLLFFLALPGLRADEALDQALDKVAPGIQKAASICLVRPGTDATGKETLSFEWDDYRDTGRKKDFWPASTIKLYAAIGALERVQENGLGLDTSITFEHRSPDGWRLDCARSLREMLHAVFSRSSNEDYTLLLRAAGIDYLNTSLLTPERGFPSSALMRGYVKGRPCEYVREEAQRVRLISSSDPQKSTTIDHLWSGRSYSAERGCTVIDTRTGNVTTARELVDCLRRLLFHEQIPDGERFHLNAEMREFLLHGGEGLTGLETKAKDSGPYAWTGSAEKEFPKARYYHKCGVISNFALEIACVDDRGNGGPCYLFAPVVYAGHASAPVKGEDQVTEMSRVIAAWVKERAAAD